MDGKIEKRPHITDGKHLIGKFEGEAPDPTLAALERLHGDGSAAHEHPNVTGRKFDTAGTFRKD